MADPAWSSSPPEVNHLRLVGAGAGGTATTIAAATAWESLVGCHEISFSVSALNTAATALDFEGVGGMSSAATATGLNSALQLLAGWTHEKVPIATAAVAAYDAAVSAMIPAAVSLANRSEQAADVALNPLVFGALTPAIVALDMEYFGEHWPQNASAGIAYGTTLAALTSALTVPPPLAQAGASPAAPATAAAALADTAGRVAVGEAMKESANLAHTAGDATFRPADGAGGLAQVGSLMSAPTQAAMSAIQPALGMFQAPLQSLQSLGGVPQAMGVVPQAMGGVLSGLPVEAVAEDDDLAGAATTPGVGTAEVGAQRIAAPSTGPVPVGGPVGATPTTGAGGNPALTSYTRPASSFTPAEGGRPTGLLSAAAAVQGPVGPAGAPLPPAPANGMLGAGREHRRNEPVHARVVLDGNRIR